MFYAVENTDGTVEIAQPEPQWLVLADARIAIIGIVNRPDLGGWKFVLAPEEGSEHERSMLVPYNFVDEKRDFQPDSIPGCLIEFAPLEKFIEQREQIRAKEVKKMGVAKISSHVGATWTKVSAKEIPDYNGFKEARKVVGGKVTVDMPVARVVHMGRIRKARAPLLLALDQEMMRADEIVDEATKVTAKQAIVERKNVLRNIPQTFDLSVAKTPEELKALWPEQVTPDAAR